MRKFLLNPILLLFALVAGSMNAWSGETIVELTATNLELATYYLDREETVTVDGITYKYYQLNKNFEAKIIDGRDVSKISHVESHRRYGRIPDPEMLESPHFCYLHPKACQKIPDPSVFF